MKKGRLRPPEPAIRNSRQPGIRQRRRRMAFLNAGFSFIVSERALIRSVILRGSLTQDGIKPPAHQFEMPCTIFDNNHRYRLCRRDIMPWREIWLLGIAKYLPYRGGR